MIRVLVYPLTLFRKYRQCFGRRDNNFNVWTRTGLDEKYKLGKVVLLNLKVCYDADIFRFFIDFIEDSGQSHKRQKSHIGFRN